MSDRPLLFPVLLLCALGFVGCSPKPKTPAPVATQPVVYDHVDPATAGTLKGSVHFSGKLPPPKVIDMSQDPACVSAHPGKQYEETLVVHPGGGLANAFVYIEAGLEGKKFEVSPDPVTIDQRGCWFRPRVLGLQIGQTLRVVNSDPVTHNIHPMGVANREWNHSQGPGDDPINRKFPKPEVMIPVKCNIHSWMHAFIGVLDHPFFAVTREDGSFEIGSLPPGTYTLAVWHEKLGLHRQQVTVSPHADAVARFDLNAK